jgi:hypothetical protein
VTVFNVVEARPGEERDAMLRRWGRSVWDAWGREHKRTEALVESVMAG